MDEAGDPVLFANRRTAIVGTPGCSRFFMVGNLEVNDPPALARKLNLSPGDYEHFDSYITKDDVRNIASFGVDHVRLGFDQIVLEEKPYAYRERTFRLVDNFIAWCQAPECDRFLP